MRAKKSKVFLLMVLVVFLLLGLGCLGLSYYYSHRFTYGTWINGNYCTGKTVAQVNELLANQTKVEDLKLVDIYGETTVIKSDDIGLRVDYSGQLRRILEGQNSNLWLERLQQNFQEENIDPEYIFSEKLLAEAIQDTYIVKSENFKLQDVVIYKSEEGYKLYDGTKGILNGESVLKEATEALWKGDFALNLAELGCYEDLELTGEMKETMELFTIIEEFQNPGIIYDMGDVMVEVGPSEVADWIALDEKGDFLFSDSGKLVLRREGIEEFIKELASEYDTYGSTRKFQATRGETVEISGGTYGNQIDQKAEVLYLTDAFLNDVSEVHVPEYEKLAYVRGKNDIGDTYIEIDMTEQKMYYYKEGQLLVETDVVTGNMKKKNGTPSGVNYVYNKQKNRILKGRDYESKVKFWMPVKGGIGIHDASWRNKFGGDIYLTNGSHGCINTPYDAVKLIYEETEIGTPVVMFY